MLDFPEKVIKFTLNDLVGRTLKIIKIKNEEGSVTLAYDINQGIIFVLDLVIIRED
jgi:hypothetical protein